MIVLRNQRLRLVGAIVVMALFLCSLIQKWAWVWSIGFPILCLIDLALTKAKPEPIGPLGKLLLPAFFTTWLLPIVLLLLCGSLRLAETAVGVSCAIWICLALRKATKEEFAAKQQDILKNL